MKRCVALIVLALVTLGGCTVSTNEEPVELSSDLFEPLVVTSTSSTSTPTPSDVTKPAEIYLLQVTGDVTSLEQVLEKSTSTPASRRSSGTSSPSVPTRRGPNGPTRRA